MSALMKLSTYNESESEAEDEIDEYEKKQESRLPLPDFLAQSQVQRVPHKEENPEGKVRNFPHEPGNWVTYIYLPLHSSKFIKYINSIMSHFEPLNLKLVDDFHISLTKTVILRHHWIPDFIKSVQKSVAEINPFKINFFGLKVYRNEEKTRSFLSLRVDVGEDNLKTVVNQLDNCLEDYNLQSFYENPSFHVSFLWCPGDKCNEINKYIESLPVKLKNFCFYEHFSYCVCACGNKKFTFYFQN